MAYVVDTLGILQKKLSKREHVLTSSCLFIYFNLHVSDERVVINSNCVKYWWYIFQETKKSVKNIHTLRTLRMDSVRWSILVYLFTAQRDYTVVPSFYPAVKFVICLNNQPLLIVTKMVFVIIRNWLRIYRLGTNQLHIRFIKNCEPNGPWKVWSSSFDFV